MAAATGRLRLSCVSSSWLEVKTANGRSLFRGTLSGSRQFQLGSVLAVIAGRPDLVQVQEGQTPPRPLGRIEQVN
jgi:cytoskeleton protein RodZ